MNRARWIRTTRPLSDQLTTELLTLFDLGWIPYELTKLTGWLVIALACSSQPPWP
jgi:hypothetical protein